MEENMTFPIKFALEKGVNDAIKDWNDKYADKLEKAIQKRALNVKLKFDTNAFDNLDDVKRRLAELKITPLTPENKTAIRDLVRELKELARIMEKIQKFKGIELPELQMAKAAKLRKDVAQADEKLRLSQERVRQSEERLILSQQRAAQQADRTSKAYGTQSGYLERLIKRMAIYASFSYAGNFLTSVREVTAQFELQRVSLGAILQDANKGEQIFSQIKQFALSSPLSILDLTKYTKQLAAYKIEYDELFDMTKRLADISVGIGADFQRIVLAAGQTRTANHLRASELKQFTELGVPLLEELSIKLSKMNGEMVTTAEVMDLISQRAISWELVKEVLYDMTDAGGMFYDMQVKQSQTLYGLWQKLGDAASVMYAQIGETSFISSGMKEAIQMLTELMRNWKAAGITAATTILPAVAAMAAWKMATKALAKSVATATSERIAAEAKLATAMKGTDVAAQNAARSTLAKAKADEAAAIAAQKHTTAIGKLKMGLVSLGKTLATGLGISIVIALITELIYKISEAVTNFHKLENELGAIYTETFTLQDQSVRNFEFLADKAVKAANGSKEQKDALDELSRTYRDILPQEALTIENLARMKGNYDALTQSIKEYIAEQQKQKAESNIYDYYNPKVSESQGVIRERLLKQGVSATEIGRFFVEFQKEGDEVFLSMEDKFRDAMEKAGVKSADKIKQIWDKEFTMEPLGQPGVVLWANKKLGLNSAYNDLVNLNEAYHNQAAELEGLSEQYHDITGEYGAFAEKIKQAKEELANIPYTNPDGSAIDQSTILFQQIKDNNAMKKAAQLIREDEDLPNAIRDKEVEWNDAWIHLVESVDPDDLFDITTIDFDAMIKAVEEKYPDLANRIKMVQKEWGNVAPTNATAQQIKVRLFQITQSFGLAMDDMRKYLWDGSGDVDAYLKRLKEQQDNLKKRLKEKQNTLLQMGILSKWWNKLMGKDIEAEVEQMKKEISALDQQIAFTTEYTIPDDKKSKSHGGTKSDPRLQILNEMVQLAEKLNKEYSDWEKKVGSTKALGKVNETYAETVKYAEKVAKDAGISLPHLKTPTNAKELNEYLEAVRKVMETAKGLKGGKKAAIELAVKMSNNVSAEDQKAIEEKIKALSDRISRTKTAKEFYEKILGQTGNRDIAKRLVTSIFGENGSALNKEIAERMRKMVEGTSATLPDFVFNADMSVNSKALRGWVEANKAALGDVAKELTKFADESEKDTAKMVEGWLKATEKAKTYGDKLADVYRTTATEIARIEAEMAKGNLGRDIGTELIAGYRRKEAEEVAKLQYEAFKDSPIYVQMFDDLDHASTRMLENMKSRLESLQGAWRNLDPTQLKEMQSRLREIDEQLAKRNPFKVMADGLREYTRLRTKGDARGNTSRANADRDATEWAEKYLEAQEELAKITSDPTATEAQIAGARQMVDYTKRQKDEAEKTAANWKKVEDAIGLSANQLMQMLNWGGDIAHAIADISEAMGADEEDIQYWNDIASGLDDVSGAIQDIVSAAMSANVVGVISSALTAIPKMFVGFANIFSAGKIKRANKEIKRQQELIEALEYSYSRLEKAAEKTFGADYLRNVNERLRMLKAEAEAYRKQAEAERSKGKKRDKEAEKEYLEHARDTADEIEELNRELQEKITGTTVEKAAEDFANAWLDAYLSFGNTAEAIKEKFRDMMKTMVVNMALSGVVERMLKPLMDMIDERAADGELSSREIAELMGAVPGYVDDIDNAMTVAMEALKAAGVDVGQLRDAADAETRGIAKGVASATSEEVNAATAVGKTLLYYASPIPRIDENLARVLALIESRGVSAIPQTTSAGWTDWQQQAMDNYQAIARNTAETVVRCERAAIACEKMARVIKTKGSTSGFNVFLNS